MPVLRRCSAALLISALAVGAHARDAGTCRYVPVADLAITLWGPSLEPLIDGEINGSKAVMLVDTGSSASMVTRAAAEKRGIPLLQTGKFAQGVGGMSQVYGVKLKDFAAGPAHSGKAGMPVVGDTTMDARIDAIVGAEFLLQTDMELALTARQLKFFRASDCADTFLAYWDKDAMEIPFTSSESRNLTPQFTIEINGKPMKAILDSGASGSVVMERSAASAGVRTDGADVTRAGKFSGIGADRPDRWHASFATFAIGSETIKNANIDIMQEPSSGRGAGMPDVILGRDFLRAHRVLFAMSQNRLYLSYTGGPVFERSAAASVKPASN